MVSSPLLSFLFCCSLFGGKVAPEEKGAKQRYQHQGEEKENQTISYYNEIVQGKNCLKKSLATMACIEIYGKPGLKAETIFVACSVLK